MQLLSKIPRREAEGENRSDGAELEDGPSSSREAMCWGSWGFCDRQAGGSGERQPDTEAAKDKKRQIYLEKDAEEGREKRSTRDQKQSQRDSER